VVRSNAKGQKFAEKAYRGTGAFYRAVAVGACRTAALPLGCLPRVVSKEVFESRVVRSSSASVQYEKPGQPSEGHANALSPDRSRAHKISLLFWVLWLAQLWQ
jgi:hypothetical protein